MDEKTLRDAMKELGRRGGKARARKLTPAQRTRSARKAGKARAAQRKREGK